MGLVPGEETRGKWSENGFGSCDFWGQHGRCNAMAIGLLLAIGAVIGGVRQDGWRWCPQHAWRVVEVYRSEQQAGRLRPGLSVYLNMVTACLQRQANASDEMRALTEWGKRLAHIGEARHAEFVQAVAQHQLAFAVQEAEVAGARVGEVERTAAGFAHSRELELKIEVLDA